MIKTSPGGTKRRYSQQLKWNYNWLDNPCKKYNSQFFSKLVFFSGCFEPLKNKQISNFNENSLKKWGNLFWIINFSFIWWATLLNNSSYEPHGTYVLWSTFVLPQEGPKNHNDFFHFCHGGGTHFLVLAQILIYANVVLYPQTPFTVESI